jgi:hypothetical protein
MSAFVLGQVCLHQAVTKIDHKQKENFPISWLNYKVSVMISAIGFAMVDAGKIDLESKHLMRNVTDLSKIQQLIKANFHLE